MNAEKKQKWGSRPKPAAVNDPVAVEAFVAGGAEQPTTVAATGKVKMKRLTIEVEPPLHKQLKTRAAQEGTTIADVVRSFLQEWAYR